MRVVLIVIAILAILAVPGVLAAALLLSGTVKVGDPMLDPAPTEWTASGRPSPAARDPELEAEIARAIESRKLFGLRSDEAWVRQVAADPTARVFMLDFPMTLEEEREFEARTTDFEQTAQAVQAYGDQHPETFGGVWVDQASRTVVAAWTRDAELQRIAILASLGRFAPVDARTVRYSVQDLAELQARIDGDMDWLRTIPAAFLGGGQMIMDNRVELWVSSAAPDAEARIMEHFGVGADMLKVTSDGTGASLMERGTIHMHVVRPDGKGTADLDWNVAWTPDRPGGGDCGEMVGIAIPEDGRFDLACAPGGWTIAIQERGGDTGWTDIGTGHVVVPEGGDVNLEITVQP